MEAIGTLLGMIGVLAMLVSFVSVLWPLKRLGLPTRKRSALALLISVWVMIIGAALMPDTPGQPPAQSLAQAAPDHASQPETPVEPPQVEAAATPQEQAVTPDQEPEPATQHTSAPGPDRIDGDNHFGCRDRDYYSKLTRFAVQGDREAWSRALAEGALSGECILFKADEPVFVTDMTWTGLGKVRRKGDINEYWTAREYVTR